MNLVKDQVYRIREDHKFWPGKICRFKFIGGPDSDCLVLVDVEDERAHYSVDALSIQGFNPLLDMVL